MSPVHSLKRGEQIKEKLLKAKKNQDIMKSTSLTLNRRGNSYPQYNW